MSCEPREERKDQVSGHNFEEEQQKSGLFVEKHPLLKVLLLFVHSDVGVLLAQSTPAEQQRHQSVIQVRQGRHSLHQ